MAQDPQENAWANLQSTLENSSDEDLQVIWRNLDDYDPTDKWDAAGVIGMDDWAEQVQSEMLIREHGTD